MTHHINSAVYQSADSTVFFAPYSDSVVYSVPASVVDGKMLHIFNVITPDEYPLVVNFSGGQIDDASSGGTLGEITIAAGRGVVIAYSAHFGKWGVISKS